MADIKKLIEIILSDEKIKKSGAAYRDEPILSTSDKLPNYIPQKIKDMRKLASEYDVYTSSGSYCFYRQGKFMEDYEDDFDYKGTFVQYFPTYQQMSVTELRGYFTWRAKVRRNEIASTSLSFAYLYIYELINLIGVKNAEEGFEKLKSFYLSYREFEKSLDTYLPRWLIDFVVYYNLDVSLVSEYTDSQFEQSLSVISDYKNQSEEELFSALSSLSSHNPEHSRFFKAYPEDFRAVVCRVFADISEYWEKHRKRTYAQKLFGLKTSCIYRIFSSAVFYDTKKYDNYEYTVNENHKYRCKNRMWTCEKYFCGSKKSGELGTLLKMTDCIMRRKYAFEKPIKEVAVTNITKKIIETETENYITEKKKREKAAISIDMSKLHIIREAAESTKEKLTAFEEETPDTIIEVPSNRTGFTKSTEENEKAPQEKEKADIPATYKKESADTPFGLDATETAFLCALLRGENGKNAIAGSGRLLSVIAESANEKLFDAFSDTVVAFNGETPYIIEDYIDELKGILKQ